jgi:[NiFe] hydrogenase diaphorase moiety large subunit
VQILHDVQDALGWLPPDALQAVAEGIGWPLARVRGTADFYSFFHTQPVGAYCVRFSDNITDRMAGGPALMAQLCRLLWLEPGKVSEDGLVSVDTTSCTGMCDQGPAALVNGRAVTGLTAERVNLMARLIREQVPLDAWPTEWFEVVDHVHGRDVLLGDPIMPGKVLRAALSHGPEGVLSEIELSGLRGRGGAGFSTGAKWRACRSAPGPEKYVVCNADEGEPGTFKDRVLLSTRFDALMDGMCVAALAVGASRGFIYLRAEYRYLLDRLRRRLSQRRAAGLLGRNILGQGFDFDIEIHLGAGAYICGEESALIESLEGKPGKPRIRPPFPVTHGYMGQPTVVNNVETLALAGLIALRGGEWFRGIGTPASSGTKVLSVSGDVARPGIYEVSFGVTLAEVLAEAGGSDAQAVTTAGAAGPCLAASEFERRICFEDVATGGSIMVFGPQRDLFDVAHNFAHFFQHESCGFCTPCRVGTTVNARLLDKLANGRGSPYDLDEIRRMHHLMQGASHCGLGNTATVAIADLMDKFPGTFQRRLATPDYEPAFDLDAALSQARQMTGRDDARAHLQTNQAAMAREARP